MLVEESIKSAVSSIKTNGVRSFLTALAIIIGTAAVITVIGIGSSAPGFADPKWVWTPSIAPSGMAFYKGEMFPQFNGHLLIGSLKLKRLYLVKLAEGSPEGEFIVFKNTIGRIRDVAVAADGSILMLTDETNGGLFRLTKKI